MLIGNRLRALRKENAYTLEYVGGLIGVAKQTLYKYENDIITNIPSDKVEALAKIYDVDPAYIMGWQKERKEQRLKTPADPNLAIVYDAWPSITEENKQFVANLVQKIKQEDLD